MFEDSLMESAGKIRSSNKWIVAGSLLLQLAALVALLLFSIHDPEAMPRQTFTTLLTAPPESQAPVVVRPAHPDSAPSRPEVAVLNISALPQISRATAASTVPNGAAPPEGWAPGAPQTGLDGGIPDVISRAPEPVVRQAARGPVRISQGVAAGQLLSPIRPQYPAIARATHTQGTVVVEAIISRQGTIENVRVLSGPIMLQEEALRAIHAARYKPYLLSGEPVEVETTINVVFSLGGS